MGMIGYRANRVSLKKKRTDMNNPKTIRQMTVGEFQGKEMPPKLRPSRSITVRPRIVRLPNQSMAFMPSMIPVLGLCTSRKKSNSVNAVPETGKET